MDRIEFLDEYHHISQHLIGIAILNMSINALEKIKPYRRELNVIRLKYIITTTDITDSDLSSVFGFDDELIKATREEINSNQPKP